MVERESLESQIREQEVCNDGLKRAHEAIAAEMHKQLKTIESRTTDTTNSSQDKGIYFIVLYLICVELYLMGSINID